MVCYCSFLIFGKNVGGPHVMSSPSYKIQAKIILYEDEESFRKEWKEKAEANVNETTFLEGIVLKSLRPGPHLYVDYSVFYGGIHDENGKSHSTSTINSLRKILHIQNHQYSTDIPAERKVEKGFYDELQCILKKGVDQLPRTPVSKDSVFILIGFHTFHHGSQTLESQWKKWSGADCILWQCPSELNLRRVTFLKHTADSCSDINEFTYFCLCECEEGLNYLSLAMDLVETLRLRHCGLVGLYQVERYYIPPKRSNNTPKFYI